MYINQGDRNTVFHPESVVWIPEARAYGYIVSYGAFGSTVWYVKDGLEFEVWLENDEFEIMENGPVEYDDE